MDDVDFLTIAVAKGEADKQRVAEYFRAHATRS
jgi:hypothetical protein